MLKPILTAALLLASSSIAYAQSTATTAAKSSPVTTGAPSQSAARYSVTTTEIGVLLDDPAARAILDKRVPGMTTNEQIDMARAMTLKDIQQYSPDDLTDKLLADIEADFAALPVKK